MLRLLLPTVVAAASLAVPAAAGAAPQDAPTAEAPPPEVTAAADDATFGSSTSGTLGATEAYALVAELQSERRRDRRRAAERLIDLGDPRLVPPVVDGLFFTPRHLRAEAFAVLEKLSGERAGRGYLDWVDLLGRRPELAGGPGYADWKAGQLARIDPRYRQILYPGAPVRLRLEEVVSGGVPLDGIPTLDLPDKVPAAEAALGGGDTVLGTVVDGVAHAWPLAVVSWHEMVNDQVGGEPVALSYCSLCRSGVLYATGTPAGGVRRLGTSGLLYRSNKLMFDRGSLTLWSNLTGEAVVGRLAGGDAQLEILPLVVTTWDEWRRRHPDTTVMAVDRSVARRYGFDYSPGAADRARRGVSFPGGPSDDRLTRNDEIFGLRLGGAAKAYPLDALLEQGVVNDVLAGEAVVVVADPASGAVRAYRRGAATFRRGVGAAELIDAAGGRWRVAEEALVAAGPADGATAPASWPRLPGQNAAWFGWYAFFPHTEVWTSTEGDSGVPPP